MVVDRIAVTLMWTDAEAHVEIKLLSGEQSQGILMVGVAHPHEFIKAQAAFLKKFILDTLQDFQAALEAGAVSQDREMTPDEEQKHHALGVEFDRVMLLEVRQAKVHTSIRRSTPAVHMSV